MNIAIYDLDKTITRRPTFTHFLLFYARRTVPIRLALLPFWILALAGYKLGLYGRKPLKQFGIIVFMGRFLDREVLQKTAMEFVADVVLPDIQPGALQSIDKDRHDGQRLVIATAAPAFYAAEIGKRMGFDDIIATRHLVAPDGRISYQIDGENCYGPEKLNMVRAWLDGQGLQRADCHIAVYTDHPSDAPLLDWADAAFLVNASEQRQLMAAQKHWQVRDFRTSAAR